MKSCGARVLLILASIGIASGVMWGTQALAQQQHIRAYYRIAIVHPESKSLLYTIVRSLRSVTRMETCKNEAPKFTARHIKQVERMKLPAEGGKPASIKLAEIRCKAD